MNFNKITLAVLMALLFVACSDDNKSVSAMGGAEEEQGVYALAGMVGDIYPKLVKVADLKETSSDSLEYEGAVQPST